MPVQFTILASGSSGNCAYLECGDTRILVDAGLSGLQIRKRLAEIGRAPEGLTGILITHEHQDHVDGLKGLLARIPVPVYCNRLTRDGLRRVVDRPMDARIFATGSSFEVGELTVESFSIPHDANDPVGFVVRTPSASFGFLTDLGHATKLAMDRVKNVEVLLLESNHDVKMLQDNVNRPWHLKQRILSRHGHLSNEAAGEVIREVMTERLQHLYLGHLSRDCNRPDIAMKVMGGCLGGLGASHVRFQTATQDKAMPTLAFA